MSMRGAVAATPRVTARIGGTVLAAITTGNGNCDGNYNRNGSGSSNGEGNGEENSQGKGNGTRITGNSGGNSNGEGKMNGNIHGNGHGISTDIGNSNGNRGATPVPLYYIVIARPTKVVGVLYSTSKCVYSLPFLAVGRVCCMMSWNSAYLSVQHLLAQKSTKICVCTLLYVFFPASCFFCLIEGVCRACHIQ